MIKHVYETLPCAGYQLEGIVKAIKLAKTDGSLLPLELSDGTVIGRCFLVTPAAKEVPPFAHPIQIHEQMPNGFHTFYIVADARGFMRMDSFGKYKITARSEYDFTVMRTYLQKLWTDGHPSDLLNCGTIQLAAFTRWVSESIAQRLGLEPLAQMRATAIAGMYYLSLFKATTDDIREDQLKMATQVAKATYIPLDKILEIVEGLDPMTCLKDFCDRLASHGQTIRLEKMNPALLYGILCGGWFGANAREIVAVALEHPPTWAALLYTAITDRGYRNCAIARYVEAVNKGDAGRTFTYNLARLPRGH